MTRLAVVGAVALLLVPACTKNYVVPPDAPSPVPSGSAPLHKIEYRATGSVTAAQLVYGDSLNGSTDITTQIPWVTSIQTRSSVFVFLKGSALIGGTLRLQIFVDDKLYVEAASTDDFQIVSVQGTVTFPTAARH